MCAAGPAGRVKTTSSCRVYLGLSAPGGRRWPCVQLGQADGRQGLRRGRHRSWKGHHCSSRGQERRSLLRVSWGTQTATGEHAGPPQPETQVVLIISFSLKFRHIIYIKTATTLRFYCVFIQRATQDASVFIWTTQKLFCSSSSLIF